MGNFAGMGGTIGKGKGKRSQGGTFNVIEAPDIVAITGSVAVEGTLAVTDTPDDVVVGVSVAGGTPGLGPNIAAQTIYFSRNSLAGSDGAYLVNTGEPITGEQGNSITGANATHFAIAADGLITPTSAYVANPQPVYTLSVTVTNAAGTSTAIVTAVTLANSLGFRTSAELTAIMALGVGVISGKTIRGRSGTYEGFNIATSAFTNKTFTSRCTLTSYDTNDKAVFRGFYYTNLKKFTLTGLGFSVAPASNAAAINMRGLCDEYEITYNDIGSDIVVDVNVDLSAGWFTNLWGIKFTNSGGYPISGVITDNDIHDVALACVPIRTGNLTFSRNIVHRIHVDGLKMSHPGAGTTTTVIGNQFYHPFGRFADVGAPHCDAIQLIGINILADWPGIAIRGNRIWVGNARGSWHGLFASDMETGYGFTGNIENNFFEVDTFHGLTCDFLKNLNVRNNTVATKAGSAAYGWIKLGTTFESGTNVVNDNIADEIILSAGVSEIGNIETGTLGAIIPYGVIYDNSPSGVPDTLAEVMSKYNMKVGGPADSVVNAGAIGTGYYNWDTNVYTNPR